MTERGGGEGENINRPRESVARGRVPRDSNDTHAFTWNHNRAIARGILLSLSSCACCARTPSPHASNCLAQRPVR